MKKAYLLLLAGMLSTAVFAGSKQTVKIDGQVIDKTVIHHRDRGRQAHRHQPRAAHRHHREQRGEDL